MSELVPNKEARFFECSWVGQFRAIDAEKAKLFAQAVADKMQEMGVQDVGWSVREGSGAEFTDNEARVVLTEEVPHTVIHDSVSHEEVQRQLKATRKEVGDGEEG